MLRIVAGSRPIFSSSPVERDRLVGEATATGASSTGSPGVVLRREIERRRPGFGARRPLRVTLEIRRRSPATYREFSPSLVRSSQLAIGESICSKAIRSEAPRDEDRRVPVARRRRHSRRFEHSRRRFGVCRMAIERAHRDSRARHQEPGRSSRNTPGFGPMSPQILFDERAGEEAGRVVRGISVPIDAGRRDDRQGEVELELVPQGTLVERGAVRRRRGSPASTPDGSGTEIARGKESRELRPQVLFRAGASRGRRDSCARPRPIRRGISCFTAAAATSTRSGRRPKLVIAEVDEIVGLGDLDPERVVTPGIFVDRVFRATVKLDRAQLIEMMAEDRSRRAQSEAARHPAGSHGARTAALFREGEIVNLGDRSADAMLDHVVRRGVGSARRDASSPTAVPGGGARGHRSLQRRRTARDRASGRGVFPLRPDGVPMARGGQRRQVGLGGSRWR